MWWKKKVSEVSTSEDDLDSASGGESDEDEEQNGPTLVTVDDGKGGVKHIKLDDPCRGENVKQLEDGVVMNHLDSSLPNGGSSESSSPGLGDLLRRELKEKRFLSMEKPQSRIVSKKGNVNIGKTKLSKRRRRFLSDFFNTMLDIQWRYVHLLFFVAFLGSWFLFALLWWLIIYYHGDFEEEHLPENQEANNWTPCVWQINNFASVFLFSVETQHTIGYGGRQTTEECPEAIAVMSFQSIVGVMIQACMVGIIFSKLARPKKRASTLMFSRNAVVCQRDGTNCLLFRVGNMRHTSLVEAHVRAILISKRVTEEGEVLPYHQAELDVGTDSEGEEDEIFFIWPTTLVHKIDEESPFYGMSARDFLKKRYEIVVILEGVIEQTGNTIQARSSYLPSEVLWGYRFVNLLNFKHSESEYKIDYSSFHSVYKVEMSQLSQELKDQCSEKDEKEENGTESEREESRISYSPSVHPSMHPSPARWPFHL